ncbi:hypothetical protein C2U37_14520 [Aeromonas sp. ASNIH1]|nr:hypothetical protein C2U37_14520 [Aeromonas sp. ASNIH1]
MWFRLALAETVPDQTRPDQTRPDQTRPDQTRPDQTRPDQTRPDQTRLGWFVCSYKVRCLACSSLLAGHLVRATAMVMAAMMQARPLGPWRSDKLFPGLP